MERFSNIYFGIDINGTIGQLQHKIFHYSYPNLEKVLEKVNFYSTEGAKEKIRQKKTASLTTAIFRGMWTFIRGYIIKLGFQKQIKYKIKPALRLYTTSK